MSQRRINHEYVFSGCVVTTYFRPYSLYPPHWRWLVSVGKTPVGKQSTPGRSRCSLPMLPSRTELRRQTLLWEIPSTSKLTCMSPTLTPPPEVMPSSGCQTDIRQLWSGGCRSNHGRCQCPVTQAMWRLKQRSPRCADSALSPFCCPIYKISHNILDHSCAWLVLFGLEYQLFMDSISFMFSSLAQGQLRTPSLTQPWWSDREWYGQNRAVSIHCGPMRLYNDVDMGQHRQHMQTWILKVGYHCSRLII